MRSFFRQQPTPASVLIQNLRNEDIDRAEAEKILENRKRAVRGPSPGKVPRGPNKVPNLDSAGDDSGYLQSTTPAPFSTSPFTPGFTDDAFYTSGPTSVPYTFESFPKVGVFRSLFVQGYNPYLNSV